MASTGADQPQTAAQGSPQQPIAGSRTEKDSAQEELSSSPVEMKTLPPSGTAPAATSSTAQPSVTTTTAAPAESTVTHTSETIPAQAPTASTAKPAPPTNLTRAETEAIGPSTDSPAPIPDSSNGPVVSIMLLLPSTGARHPYKIDEKYLKKRNVVVDNMDPYNISVSQLKDLIWRDWREEWEPRPTSPSSIRLIHFGRMLDDKSPLTECRFQTDTPNVVHMTVRPQDVVDEEDAKISKGGNRRDGDEEPTAGCRCVIL